LQKTEINEKIGVSNEEWTEMAKLLDEIEMEYFYLLGFPKKGKESGEDIEKIKVVMPTFMNYFFNGPLSYQEQEIEKIERVFEHFENEINDEYGLSLSDFISFYDFINEQINSNLNKSVKFFNPETWQAFTKQCIDKGLDNPKDWIKEAPDELIAGINFFKNPGSFLLINVDQIAYPTISKEKVKSIFKLFSCKSQAKNEITFYTDDNVLLNNPFFEVRNNEYLLFFKFGRAYAQPQALLPNYSRLKSSNIGTDKMPLPGGLSLHLP
jgi:hypothetical protein